MNNQKKWSCLKTYKSGKYQYIYIYFKLGRNRILINTKNQYVKSYMNADLTYNTKMPDHERLNMITNRLQNQVERYINWQMKEPFPEVSQEACKRFLKDRTYHLTNEPVNEEKSINKSLLEYFENFYSFKQKELNNKPSVKDYLSLKNALVDFEYVNNRRLTLKDIDIHFLLDFRQFLTVEHPKECTTRGNLNDNTLNKRISSFKSFMSYLESEDVYRFKKKLYEFKTPTYENTIVVLTKDEIKTLLELEIKNKSWQKLIDIFICNCFCGLRYADLRQLSKEHFTQDTKGNYFIEMETQKTSVEIKISVQQTSLNIFKKYNFDLNAPESQYYNRQLKKIFEHYELFSEPVLKKRKQIKEGQSAYLPKYKLIASHTCRRTFITLCINNHVPINSIMKATGHKKIQTLQKYMKLETDVEAFKRIDL